MRASCDIDRIILQTKNEKPRKNIFFKKREYNVKEV